MNPISQLLKLPAEATVGDAKKLVAEQVMSSMSSYPGREALLSALECGPYDKKFGKKRGKSLTLLNEQLSLEEHHAMILQEASRELRGSYHELLQDELEARPRYRLNGDQPVLVNFETPESLPADWQLDLLKVFKTPESTLKKQARELILAQAFLTKEQLSPAQLAALAAATAAGLGAGEGDDEAEADDDDDEDDKD